MIEQGLQSHNICSTMYSVYKRYQQFIKHVRQSFACREPAISGLSWHGEVKPR